MFYDFAITIPAGTLERSPKKQVLKLTHGVIHRVELEFPAGCRGYAHLVLLHDEHQLYPLAAKIWAFNHLKGEVEKPSDFISEEQLGEFANFFKEGK